MLFTYRYLENHRIEKLQSWLDYLVLEVWCKAAEEYDISLLDGCPELREVVDRIYNDDRINTDYLYGPIKEIYDIFLTFDARQKLQLKSWYLCNNDIETLCSGEGCTPLTYKVLNIISKPLSENLKRFCVSLYTDVIGLNVVSSKTGQLREHYKEFVEKNGENICPFCGINLIKGQYHSKKEAYDHFLPKGTYPFNAVNFRNLAPMCHECNSSYKIEKNPLYAQNTPNPLIDKFGKRRKVFYPYGTAKPDIKISINLLSKNIVNLKPDDLELTISSTVHHEEVDTWREMFGIDERYKATCCYKNFGSSWYKEIMSEIHNAEALTNTKISISDWFSKVKRATMIDQPYTDMNFLKRPFLEGCERAGLFREI